MYYSLMKDLETGSSQDTNEEIIFISRLFSILVDHLDFLPHVLLRDNIDDEKNYSHLRNQNFSTCKMNVKEFINDYSLHLGKETLVEADLFESLTKNCLANILKSRDEDICVLNKKMENNFKIFLESLYRCGC